MSVLSDQATSRGDLMSRLDALERQVAALRTGRRLPNAAVGQGGLRIHSGGGLLVEGVDGEDVMHVTADPPAIEMRPELIATLTRQITGESVNFDFVAPQESVNSEGAFTDLATIGPQVTADVSSVGRALVHIGCIYTYDTLLDHVSMSFEVSGSSPQPPSGARAVQVQCDQAFIVTSAATAVLVDGLDEGTHTFTAKYANTTIGANGFFSNRFIIVYPY